MQRHFVFLTLQLDFVGKVSLFHVYFVGKHELTSWAKVYHEVKTKERKISGNFSWAAGAEEQFLHTNFLARFGKLPLERYTHFGGQCSEAKFRSTLKEVCEEVWWKFKINCFKTSTGTRGSFH